LGNYGRGRLKKVLPYEKVRPYKRRINMLENDAMLSIARKAPIPEGAYRLLLRLFRAYVISWGELCLIDGLSPDLIELALLALRWYIT
jgi:hypothetical protein